LEQNGLELNKKIAIPVDLIRTIAIGLVVLLHASNEALEASSVPMPYWWTALVYKSLALSCVPLFVMLSGALLLQPAKLDEPIRVFLRKRLSRIGLAFGFWSMVYLAWGFYVTNVPVTLSYVVQGIVKDFFTGAWYHFWFIYLIVGLYLITPILRIFISNGNPRITRYLISIWFIGIAIIPLIQFGLGYTLNAGVFIIGGFIGYFVMGNYLQKITLRPLILLELLIASFIGTVFAVWLMTYPLSSLGQNNYFLGYLTLNVIVGSAALFLILLKFKPDWPETKNTTTRRVIQAISNNTLPIFLFHIVILETFERGLLGFKISFTNLNPIVEIPLLAALTFFITFGLVLLMRKVPVLKKLIG
jgi:surface polysaccharide O-acyltransferase-like enzyme